MEQYKGEVTVVIPALNEEQTVTNVVIEMKKSPYVKEVIVVNNGSTDLTKVIAKNAGARVLDCDISGYGYAMKTGLKESKTSIVFKLDADMTNPDSEWIEVMLEKFSDSTTLVKGYWDNKVDPMPVTNLVVKPAIELLFPSLSYIKMPISGIYLFNKDLLDIDQMANDFSFDIDILCSLKLKGCNIDQVFLGEVYDKLKPVENYINMSRQLLERLHNKRGFSNCEKVLIVLAHADDAEIWCGGTIINHALKGSDIHIVIATKDVKRVYEAEKIKKMVPNVKLSFLEAEEGGPFVSQLAPRLRQIIESGQPNILITHHFGDQHNDHQECYKLATSALMAMDRSLLPEKIYLCNSYNGGTMNTPPFKPDVFIDISQVSHIKETLISHYESQDTSHWLHMANTTDQFIGMQCGVKKAEAFQRHHYYWIKGCSNFL